MKEEYLAAEVEVIEFREVDILVESPPQGEGDVEE